MKTNKSYKTPLTFMIFALALLGTIWFLFGSIQQDSNNLVATKNSIVALDAQSVETQKFKEKYQDYKPNLEKISSMFVDMDNPVDFIKFLENSAADSDMTSQISLPSAPQLAGQNFAILQFSGTGYFSDVFSFIKTIESGSYLLEVENLSIQPTPNTSSKAVSKTVDASFTLKVFTK
jgi:hypothetical protein